MPSTKFKKIRHLALIGDGNRRWASARGLRPEKGHMEALKALRQALGAWAETGIPYLTFWWSSEDNLRKRGAAELAVLYAAQAEMLRSDFLASLAAAHGVRVSVRGRWRDYAPEGLAEAADALQSRTSKNRGRVLTLLLGYNCDRELLDALRRVPLRAPRAKLERALRQALLLGDLPDVDLLVRTGGRPHNSAGFMMWLTRNSYYRFLEKRWPDFTRKDFFACCGYFSGLRPKFGR